MAADMAALTGDLAAESADLFPVVSGLAEPDWRRETPSAGWTIRDQVATRWPPGSGKSPRHTTVTAGP